MLAWAGTSDEPSATSVLRAALRPRDPRSPSLQWSLAAIEAVHRIDELVARDLDVARCGLWTVTQDASRAVCVDLYARDGGEHRRDADRADAAATDFHRALDAAGLVAGRAEPAGSGVLAAAVRHGGRLVAYLCAEQRAGGSRSWTAEDERFMRSMSDVVREVLALAGASQAGPASLLFEHLPVVAYRGTRIADEWTLTRISDAAERLLGCAAAELVGRPLAELRGLLGGPPAALPASGEFEQRYRREAVGAPARRFIEKGSIGTDPSSGAPMIEGLITEISAGTDAGGDSAAQLELLSHVSHELHTPLNAILGFAQLIELDLADNAAQRREYVMQIQRAGRHLLEVIRETMDLTRLQAGPPELNLEPVPLARAVDDCLPMVSRQAAQAAVQLVNAVHDGSLGVVVDARRFSQALVNLLSNAVKYNRAGGSVTVEAEALGDLVRLRVSDNGIGLTAQQTEALFQPFNRLGMEHSEIEGVGLGLVITRKLIEAMGGRIAVVSQAGVGSTFEVTLPRAAS